jgi:hypothetical protein
MLVKYLGVVLDSQLTWREHMDVKVRKVHHLLLACRRVYGVTWGLRPKAVRRLYVSVIRPSIAFASLVWWPGYQMASTMKTLNTVQRLSFLGITGTMHTTPTTAMEDLICFPPLGLVVQSVARSAAQVSGVWLQQSDPIFNMG